MRPSEILAAKADEIREIIARYPVGNPRIFGSAARGDDEEGSDLDLLVDPLRGTTYLTLAKLQLELEAFLGVGVDIATPGAIGPRLAERVNRDLRPLCNAPSCVRTLLIRKTRGTSRGARRQQASSHVCNSANSPETRRRSLP